MDTNSLVFFTEDHVLDSMTTVCSFHVQVRAASSTVYPTSTVGRMGVRDPFNQAKYLDLLARYYIMKRQHLLAAHVLLKLAERRSMDDRDVPSLEQRLVLYFYILTSSYSPNNNKAHI